MRGTTISAAAEPVPQEQGTAAARAQAAMDEQIYHQPEIYDLEHARVEPDVGFFLELLREWHPQRVLEVACGNGRLLFPLARALARWEGKMVGIDLSEEMIRDARERAAASAVPSERRVEFHVGDMRAWLAPAGFDLILCGCASMSHLLALEDQLAAWKCAYTNLLRGGRFVVAEQMASLPAFAESMQTPPRALLEIDRDTSRGDGAQAERLVRYKATRYFAHEQRASVRFLYDRLFDPSAVAERFLSDYECHVFYPRELELLFRITGFEVEAIWGDYQRAPLRSQARELIVVGRKP